MTITESTEFDSLENGSDLTEDGMCIELIHYVDGDYEIRLGVPDTGKESYNRAFKLFQELEAIIMRGKA